MNILLISQCSKNAREESCRILDQFAERKGDAANTFDGLDTLRRLLRNTAVVCHWIKKSGQTDLLGIVGNARRFSATGAVPTNRTLRDILRNRHESNWRSTESIALLAGIAGLFHAFGKAGALFQDNLKGEKCTHRYQPFRHELISVRLFQAFIGVRLTKNGWLNLARSYPSLGLSSRYAVFCATSNPIFSTMPRSSKELEVILRDPALSNELRTELNALAPKA